MPEETKLEGLAAVMSQFRDTAPMTLEEMAEKAPPVSYTTKLPFTYAFALESVNVEGLSRHGLTKRLLEDAIRRMLTTGVIPASEGQPEIRFREDLV